MNPTKAPAATPIVAIFSVVTAPSIVDLIPLGAKRRLTVCRALLTDFKAEFFTFPKKALLSVEILSKNPA
jgi:hypothetical protein